MDDPGVWELRRSRRLDSMGDEVSGWDHPDAHGLANQLWTMSKFYRYRAYHQRGSHRVLPADWCDLCHPTNDVRTGDERR